MAVVLSAELEVSILNRAFNDQSPSSTIFHQQKVAAGTTPQSWSAYALQFGSNYQVLSEGALAVQLLSNMGLQADIGLQGALVSYLESVGKANVGVVAVQLGHILLGLEDATGDLAVYKAPAKAWSKEIADAYTYSTNSANGSPSPVGPKGAHAGWNSAMAADHLADAQSAQLIGVSTPAEAVGPILG